MQATIGDRLHVHGRNVGNPDQLAEIIDVRGTDGAPPYLVRYSAGFSPTGQIEAVKLAFFSDGGWSLDLSEPIMWRSLFHCDNAYYLPNLEATGRVLSLIHI